MIQARRVAGLVNEYIELHVAHTEALARTSKPFVEKRVIGPNGCLMACKAGLLSDRDGM